jgi:hypothetical protein
VDVLTAILGVTNVATGIAAYLLNARNATERRAREAAEDERRDAEAALKRERDEREEERREAAERRATEEHAQRQAERAARARLRIEPRILVHEPDADLLLMQGGSGGDLRLEITIHNDGERDAGRGKIEVTFPQIVTDTGIRWTNAGGHELPDSERAARVAETNVTARAFEGVSRDMPERLYVKFPIAVPPDRETIYDYPITVRLVAEGADAEQVEFPLRVGAT